MGVHGDYPDSWDNPGNIGECEFCDTVHELDQDCPTDIEVEIEKLCDFVNREVRQLTALTRQKAGTLMNVGRFNTGGGNYENLPLLDSRAFNREKDSKGFVVAKILAAREIKSKKKSRWEGLALDIKAKSGTKYSFLMKTGDKSGQVDSYDIGAICQQTNSEETDDWIGESIKFVSKKGKTGGVFVNVFRPTSKKGKK